MGFFQSHVRHGRSDGETWLILPDRAITIVNHAQAEAAWKAAAAVQQPLTVISPFFGAQSLGPGLFDSLIRNVSRRYPGVRVTAILDCGDAPGLALAALRQGCTSIRFDGTALARIENIAAHLGATVYTQRPPSLDLNETERAGRNLFDTCLEFLRLPQVDNSC